MEGEQKYLASLGEYRGISSEVWQKLAAYFNSFESAWDASENELRDSGIPNAAKLIEYRNQTDPEKVWAKYQEFGIRIIPLMSPEYPALLKEIFAPPFVLYVRGEILPQDELAIAVVGSRKATDYGKRVTTEISKGLAQAGVTIISGLALGLDAEAHKAALACGGRTIAVLSNGLDKIYPSSNYALGREIIKHGALISEQPIGLPPLRQNFPARNRIISGLSKGVLVTEAGEHSGTLHTANFALEQNRQIYAVPGPIYNPLSKGPNDLLKMGAKATACAQDILEDLGIEGEANCAVPENEKEVIIFKILETEPKHIDLITKESQKESHEISQILTMMEIKGKVRHLGGMVYSLRN